MLRQCSRRVAAGVIARQAVCAALDSCAPGGAWSGLHTERCCEGRPDGIGNGGHAPQACWMPWSRNRGFAAEAAVQQPDTPEVLLRRRVSEANMVLQSIEAMQFRELLEDLSEERLHMPYKELLQKSVDSGAAGSPEEAGHLCEALRAAGVVVRVGGIVFLRPDEVAETILKALPDTEQEVQARLQELHLELEPLREQKRNIDGRVQRRTRRLLWTGLAFLMVQWGMLARLTFWELSWDVIEPITYFLGSGTTILFYCYFMATREEFAYNKGVSRLERTYQEDKYKEHGFDLRQFERLKRDVRRYERYMRRASDQHVSVFPEPEAAQGAGDTSVTLTT